MSAILDVKAFIDISPFWVYDEYGRPLTVNAVYSRFINTDNQVSYETLRMAYEGRLDRGKISNQVKLARIASELSGQAVTINDLLKIEEDV